MCRVDQQRSVAQSGISRRAALTAAVATGAGALAAATLGSSAGFAQVGRDPLLDGVVDVHVHADPDVDARSLDDVQVAEKYAEAGARAILLKNHYVATSDRAYLARGAVRSLEVFGGITLNKQVGGLNASAIQSMAQMKGRYGKVVWFPTRDAPQHLDRFPRDDTPVAVVDEGGELLPEARACLEVIAGENLALFTGHLSASDAMTLLREASAMGVTKMLVTHAIADPARFSMAQLQAAVAVGAMIEHVYLGTLAGPSALSPGQRVFRNVPVSEYVAAINAVGASNSVLSSDLGQAENPIHPMGFRVFISQLTAAGISREDIDLMARRNPARLLDLT
jgi:hypothetical protein